VIGTKYYKHLSWRWSSVQKFLSNPLSRYESLTLIILYILYVILTYHNKRIVDHLVKNKDKQSPKDDEEARSPLLKDDGSLSKDITSNSCQLSGTNQSGNYGSLDKTFKETGD